MLTRRLFCEFPNFKVAKLHAEAPATPSTMRDDTHDAATPSTRRPSPGPRAPAAGSNKDPTALDRIRYRICKIAEDIIKLEEMLGYLLEALDVIEIPPEPPEQLPTRPEPLRIPPAPPSSRPAPPRATRCAPAAPPCFSAP